MTPSRCSEICARFASLRMAVVGDFCLDRYLEIDPMREERSIETGRAVHRVMRVRSQPGAAGTILANLAALGVGSLHAIGFCGEDGEGFELQRALRRMPGVDLSRFIETPQRVTFTYTKPLLCPPGARPAELDRLDIRDSTPTPAAISAALAEAVIGVAGEVDAIVVMDQAGDGGSGAITAEVERALGEIARSRPTLLIFADSRSGTRVFANLGLKMNASEYAARTGREPDVENVARLADEHGRAVFVTLAERGITGALPGGEAAHIPAKPVQGGIDIVGAGDAVLANLAAALGAGANVREAMELAMAAASVVIHKLGATGTATGSELRAAFDPAR